MTKKDYILIARVVATHVSTAMSSDERNILFQFSHHLAQELKEDNRAFDKNRFLKACGFGEEGKCSKTS